MTGKLAINAYGWGVRVGEMGMGRRKPAAAAGRVAGVAAGDDGFALLDAVTALLILSITLGLAFQAGRTALQAAGATAEIEDARAMLDDLMQARFDGEVSGLSPRLAWRVSSEKASAQGPFVLCHRTAEVRARRDQRRLSVETLEPCRSETSHAR